jgi:N-acetylglucosaminyldiphosphoundecaprenol N-acetyl-beta-D-mannosaminyltransferase
MNLRILGVRLDHVTYETAVSKVVSWARGAESRHIVAANVHTIMEAFDDPALRGLVNGADMITADGMPLVWLLRLKGWRDQTRVYGPTLMEHTLRAAAQEGLGIGFYGSSPATLAALEQRVRSTMPGIRVVFSESPPFGDLEMLTKDGASDRIVASGARIVFVGLGCPKQERWMAVHRDRIPAVMLGVGAAFDFLAGTKRQAPGWMRRAGLEWLFRFGQEPVRLAGRYLRHNPRFLVLAAAELVGIWSPG